MAGKRANIQRYKSKHSLAEGSEVSQQVRQRVAAIILRDGREVDITPNEDLEG